MKMYAVTSSVPARQLEEVLKKVGVQRILMSYWYLKGDEKKMNRFLREGSVEGKD